MCVGFVSLTGIVYVSGGRFRIADERLGDKDLLDEASGLVGKMIHMFVHHAPPDPPQHGKWGGGCCMWGGSERCPASHHERPGYLYEASGTGELKVGPESFSTTSCPKPEVANLKMLDGHRCRIVLIPDVSSLSSSSDDCDIDHLRAMLKELLNTVTTSYTASKNR